MIPYEQLVSALTSWRQRHGLPTASADLFGDSPGLPIGELPVAAAVASYQESYDGHGGGYGHSEGEGYDEVAELGHEDVAEEMADDAVVAEDAVVEDGGLYADPEATAIGQAGDYTAVAEYDEPAEPLDGEGDIGNLAGELADDTSDEPGR